MIPPSDRRRFLTRAAATLGLLPLAGCDELSARPWLTRLLASAERLTHWAQRDLLPHRALAREYSEADVSLVFKANGSTNPRDPDYRRLAEGNFVDWRLDIRGLVETPLRLSLDQLRAMPSRTQITRHDCVEGWSCIGKWTGVPLAALLAQAGMRPQARYAVFHCADTLEEGEDRYYESVGLDDATHPQTILAYELNGAPLPIAHGAPLRVRIERQLGYKSAKYLMAIELVDSLAGFGAGKGGFWEDRGYEWYAGI